MRTPTGSDDPAATVPPWVNRRRRARRIIYSDSVDIRIGIANSPRELSFESSHTAAEVEKVVSTPSRRTPSSSS